MAPPAPFAPPDLPTPQRPRRYVPDVPPNLRTGVFFAPPPPAQLVDTYFTVVTVSGVT